MPETEFIQVVIVPALRLRLEQWLAANGLALAKMPIDNPDDLPTYGVYPMPSAAAPGGPGRGEDEQAGGRRGGGQ